MKTADLLTKLQTLTEIDPETITDRELFSHATQYEEIIAAVCAKDVPIQYSMVPTFPSPSEETR